MIRRALFIAGVLAIILACSPLANAFGVQNVVNQVSQTSYQNYLSNVLYTHNGDNRGVGGPQHDTARTNIYKAFAHYGLSTSLDPFVYTYGGGTRTDYNVVGIRLGKVRPNDIYIVGGHYDSVNNPGADDNGSGVAGVMEAARVLSQYDFEATLAFIAFDREELGLIGSSAYAQKHSTDHILGMLSLDMIAFNYSGASNSALIYGRASSDPVKQLLANSISLYGNGITSTIQGQLDASDHAPFEWAGFEAALLIEGGVWSNPNYHSAADSVDTAGYIDYLYATNMTRSAVGYLATSAGLVPIPEPGSLLPVGSGFVWLILVLRRRARRAS